MADTEKLSLYYSPKSPLPNLQYGPDADELISQDKYVVVQINSGRQPWKERYYVGPRIGKRLGDDVKKAFSKTNSKEKRHKDKTKGGSKRVVVDTSRDASRADAAAREGATTRNGSISRNGANSKEGVVSRNGVNSREGTISINGAMPREGAMSRNGSISREGAISRNGANAKDGALSRNGPNSRDGAASRNSANSREGAVSRNGASSREGAMSMSIYDAIPREGVMSRNGTNSREGAISRNGANSREGAGSQDRPQSRMEHVAKVDANRKRVEDGPNSRVSSASSAKTGGQHTRNRNISKASNKGKKELTDETKKHRHTHGHKKSHKAEHKFFDIVETEHGLVKQEIHFDDKYAPKSVQIAEHFICSIEVTTSKLHDDPNAQKLLRQVVGQNKSVRIEKAKEAGVEVEETISEESLGSIVKDLDPAVLMDRLRSGYYFESRENLAVYKPDSAVKNWELMANQHDGEDICIKNSGTGRFTQQRFAWDKRPYAVYHLQRETQKRLGKYKNWYRISKSASPQRRRSRSATQRVRPRPHSAIEYFRDITLIGQDFEQEVFNPLTYITACPKNSFVGRYQDRHSTCHGHQNVPQAYIADRAPRRHGQPIPRHRTSCGNCGLFVSTMELYNLKPVRDKLGRVTVCTCELKTQLRPWSAPEHRALYYDEETHKWRAQDESARRQVIRRNIKTGQRGAPVPRYDNIIRGTIPHFSSFVQPARLIDRRQEAVSRELHRRSHGRAVIEAWEKDLQPSAWVTSRTPYNSARNVEGPGGQFPAIEPQQRPHTADPQYRIPPRQPSLPDPEYEDSQLDSGETSEFSVQTGTLLSGSGRGSHSSMVQDARRRYAGHSPDHRSQYSRVFEPPSLSITSSSSSIITQERTGGGHQYQYQSPHRSAHRPDPEEWITGEFLFRSGAMVMDAGSHRHMHTDDPDGVQEEHHGSAALYERGSPYGSGTPYERGSQHGSAALYERGSPYGSRTPYDRGSQHGSAALYERGSPYGSGTPYERGSQHGSGALYEQHGSGAPYERGSQHGSGSPYERGSQHGSGAPYERESQYGIGAAYGMDLDHTGELDDMGMVRHRPLGGQDFHEMLSDMVTDAEPSHHGHHQYMFGSETSSLSISSEGYAGTGLPGVVGETHMDGAQQADKKGKKDRSKTRVKGKKKKRHRIGPGSIDSEGASSIASSIASQSSAEQGQNSAISKIAKLRSLLQGKDPGLFREIAESHGFDLASVMPPQNFERLQDYLIIQERMEQFRSQLERFCSMENRQKITETVRKNVSAQAAMEVDEELCYFCSPWNIEVLLKEMDRFADVTYVPDPQPMPVRKAAPSVNTLNLTNRYDGPPGYVVSKDGDEMQEFRMTQAGEVVGYEAPQQEELVELVPKKPPAPVAGTVATLAPVDKEARPSKSPKEKKSRKKLELKPSSPTPETKTLEPVFQYTLPPQASFVPKTIIRKDTVQESFTTINPMSFRNDSEKLPVTESASPLPAIEVTQEFVIINDRSSDVTPKGSDMQALLAEFKAPHVKDIFKLDPDLMSLIDPHDQQEAKRLAQARQKKIEHLQKRMRGKRFKSKSKVNATKTIRSVRILNRENDADYNDYHGKRGKWSPYELGLSQQASRFEIPHDVTILKDITPIEYLTDYVSPDSKRDLLYQKLYSLNRTKFGLTLEGLKEAIKDVIISYITDNEVDFLLDITGISDSTVINYSVFAGFAAFAERFALPKFLKGLPLPVQQSMKLTKVALEVCDFNGLDYRLANIELSPNMRKVLDIIRNSDKVTSWSSTDMFQLTD